MSVYSVETQKVLTDALNSAKIVFADKNATQTEIDHVVKLLQASVDGLRTSETTDSNKKPAKTGDATTSVAWGFAGIPAALAAVVAFFKEKDAVSNTK